MCSRACRTLVTHCPGRQCPPPQCSSHKLLQTRTQGQVTVNKRPSQKQRHDFGEIPHKKRQGSCLPSTYQVTMYCFLQKMLETRAMLPSRDAAQLATFPWHLPCLHRGKGSGRSHRYSYLAEQQPQSLLQMSSKKSLYFSAKK